VNPRRWLAGLAIAIVLAVAGWFGWRHWHRQAVPTRPSTAEIAVPDSVRPNPNAPDVVSVDTGLDSSLLAGSTPMADRVAVVGLLNKRNGETRDLTLKPGQATRVGDVIVRLRACERTAPWEQEQYTGAFVQMDVRGTDAKWRRAFSGWLFKERPALNVVLHPIYDVWPKSCTMSFPDWGPDTVSAGTGATSSGTTPRRSSASNAAEASPEAPAESNPSAPANSTE
jgi:hypothetical protein